MHGLRLQIVCTIPLILLLFRLVGGEEITQIAPNKTTNSSSSPWITKVMKPRAKGCRFQPWICNPGKFPPKKRKMCCLDRCVDVTSDMMNCGLCGIRCPFTWQCCYGLCIDTNINPFHCGSCTNRCPFGVFCFYGMCGYAQPFPPFPCPPKLPFPPFPFPPFPFPPKQPKPLPPKQPKPFPPKPPKVYPPPQCPPGPPVAA